MYLATASRRSTLAGRHTCPSPIIKSPASVAGTLLRPAPISRVGLAWAPCPPERRLLTPAVGVSVCGCVGGAMSAASGKQLPKRSSSYSGQYPRLSIADSSAVPRDVHAGGRGSIPRDGDFGRRNTDGSNGGHDGGRGEASEGKTLLAPGEAGKRAGDIINQRATIDHHTHNKHTQYTHANRPCKQAKARKPGSNRAT